ncbi:MAG: peptide deformylase [Methanomicrobium sp.]|nr:peptide deformylase [Methanomicrobium sp.]
MIQKIRLYGDPVLFESCDTVESIGDSEKAILEDMWDTMLHNNCVGLSAPQIGVAKRLFVMNAGGVAIRGANPEVLSEGVMSEDTEGSPCIPGIHRPIRRPKKIVCRYLDVSGETVERELKGLAARAFLHEKDHHDGIMFIDHLKPFQRKLIQKDLDKIKQEFERNSQQSP